MYDTQTLPIADPTNYSIGGAAATQTARMNFLKADYAAGDEPVRSEALSATATVDLLKSIPFSAYKPANAAVYPNSSFGRALKSVAVLISQNIGLEAAQVDIGGWDTHSTQDPNAGSMFRTMQDFSNSLAAFYADIISTHANVTVVAFSEFGRNVRENGSQGTDHGAASAMLVMGGKVNGGLYGTAPVLNTDPKNPTLENNAGDVTFETDFRSVYARVADNWLGASSVQLLGGDFRKGNLTFI